MECLTRLRDSAELIGISESLILKKLRGEKSVRELLALFFAIGADMNAIISRFWDWEPLLTSMTKNNIVIKQKKTFLWFAFPDNKRRPLRCLKCNKIGHIHRDCMFKSNSKTNMIMIREQPIDVDVDDVSINRSLFVSCFDSGSSVNIVSKKALRSFEES
ncbi:hypothetical protein CDIK_4030 [Cucumispora dikerogammari]|nr:hypothetical protein CDIK_4030 [Cucumispora dikerogammari]